MTRIWLVGEDELCLSVLDRLLADTPTLEAFRRDNTCGFGRLKVNATKYSATAEAGLPVIALTDLDDRACPGDLLTEWLPGGRHSDFLLRVAVREVEAWLLADRPGFAAHFGAKLTSIPAFPETCADAKAELLGIVSGTRKARWKGMLPDEGRRAPGPDYNDCLRAFVRERWSPAEAQQRAPSLAKAIERLGELAARHR